MTNPHRWFRVDAIHPAWKREPNSPFARHSTFYADPSAAHEAAMRLKNQGHHNVLVVPTNENPHDRD
jgi:hypothetical protein